MPKIKKTKTTLQQQTTAQETAPPFYDKKNDTRNMTTAVILILFGFIFLLNNFGLIPWSIWTGIWKFWPVLLILWGLQIIVGNSKPARLFMALVTLLVVGYILLISIAKANLMLRDYLTKQFPNLYFSNQLYRYDAIELER